MAHVERVKGGMAVEKYVKYYRVSFIVINQSFRLTDKDDKTIKRKKNDFIFEMISIVSAKNVNDCLSAYQIKPEHK
jgi:hypothetical protein